jgi:hypothetical protein
MTTHTPEVACLKRIKANTLELARVFLVVVAGTIDVGSAAGQLPTVSASAANDITTNHAVVTGALNPNGLPTTYYWQWGTSTSYGKTTPDPSFFPVPGPIYLTADLWGLSPDTTYHYQLVASNSAGSVATADLSFSTPGIISAQGHVFTYVRDNGGIIITGYSGPGGTVPIPNAVAGLPVTAITNSVFATLTSLTGVSFPDTVTSLSGGTFEGCTSLQNVILPPKLTRISELTFFDCASMTNVTISTSVTNIGRSAFGYCTSLTNLTIPGSVTSIGESAFGGCTNLTNLTIPGSVTSMGDYIFGECANLMGLYFRENAPSVGLYIFTNCNNVTVYYLSGTTGWGPTFGGRPAVLWNPQVQTGDAMFGVRQNGFGFNIGGMPDVPLLIEGSTGFVGQPWVSLQTCTLTNGSIYFNDPQWTNYPGRFYRIRSP